MFWSVVLPFKITFWCIAGLILFATLVAPLVKCKRLHMFSGATLLGFLAFIPSCGFVANVLDAKRFGVFEYASFAEVNDSRIQYWLPPTARDITLVRYAQGFRARYSIAKSDLDVFLSGLWEADGGRSVAPRREPESRNISPEFHEHVYGDVGWPLLPDITEYHSPTAGDGAGFTVWFSASQGIAYQQAGYF